MDITPEHIAAAGVFFGTAIGALGVYLRTLRQPKPDPVLSGVAGGFLDREQMERLIAQVTRIADALTDKNSAGIKDSIEELAERLDKMQPRRR